ncbi:MAG: hypothetical protein P4M09_26585 [Devosia sp.]|nr:hypothetical protein [Devosia sp.]
MQQPVKVVAVLAANPALSSVLSAVLASTPSLRVRQFESQIALQTYMRLSVVDLLVADFDCEAAPAAALARLLRLDDTLVRRGFQIIALAGDVTEDLKQASIASGIDEVIVKPMSPKYLLERVRSRLKQPAFRPGGPSPAPVRREWLPTRPPASLSASYAARGDNVVQLFTSQRLPTA